MKHLLQIIVIVLVSASPLISEEVSSNPVILLHQLILPELKLEGATLHQSVAAIKTEWEKAHPDRFFPVITLELSGEVSAPPFNASLHFKEIPALTAITYLANAFGLTVRHGLDVIVLRPVVALDEDAWRTVLLQPSEKVMSFFQLPAYENGDKEFNTSLKKKLEKYGIRFEQGFEIVWLGSQLCARNTPEEISKMKGLFMLIDAGHPPARPL